MVGDPELPIVGDDIPAPRGLDAYPVNQDLMMFNQQEKINSMLTMSAAMQAEIRQLRQALADAEHDNSQLKVMIIAWLYSRCGGSAWLTRKDLIRVQEISKFKLEIVPDEEGERTLIRVVRVDPEVPGEGTPPRPRAGRGRSPGQPA